MNAYAVCIPEERVHQPWGEPPEWGVPVGIFLAETAGQAKIDALRAWVQRPMGVYSDDFPAIRARKLCTISVGSRGEVKDPTDVLWIVWPEGWPEIERP